ncbi:hypothetical protein [Aquabacterium sp. J223]|uniref:hypothetical protein n=1 Tax=Aquabacterium sp. J223 TaxID=2898431 RepID=UPI0021ADB81C|nr:hypothetical protein [Aquabacterium sp. J223]UUX95913.1 hypothetical protein LRS07_00735 [Aquabacterium sp. J223]
MLASLVLAFGVGLAACACASADDDRAGPGCRVQVRTAADWPDTAALAGRVATASGASVARGGVAVIGPRWFALSLQADGDAACRQALDRLAADRGLALDVLPDTTRRRPPSPDRASAR